MKDLGSKKNKIGIISGVFDPVHIGHIKLAQKAKSDLSLDEIYFLCEETPRGKVPAASFHDRKKMLQLAADEFGFQLLNLSSKTFSLADLSLISTRFQNDQIYLIMGSDAFSQSQSWFSESSVPYKNIELVGYARDEIAGDTSSGNIKLKLKKGDFSGLPSSVAKYIKLKSLYSV